MQRHRVRKFVVATFLLLAWLASGNAAVQEAIDVSKTRLQLPGGAITADVFEARDARKHPIVLVLHGAGGTLLDGPEMRRVARGLAADGNAVYLLHYFARTGTIVALDSTMQRHFDEWLETVRAAVVAVQRARADSSPVGVYGYSLGAFLALAVASDNPRIGAVVEQAGGVWNGRMERIERMPPVLMLHGRRDARVPFERYAQPLIPILRRRGSSLETRFFPDEGHGFTPAAMTTVRVEAAKFFRKHLRRS